MPLDPRRCHTHRRGLDIVGDARHDMGVTLLLNNSTTLAELVSQLYRIRPARPTRTAGFFMRQPKPKTNLGTTTQQDHVECVARTRHTDIA